MTLAVAVAAISVGATMVPIMWPPEDEVARADAIIVLSGDHGDRLEVATELLRRNVATTLVFDGTPDSEQAVEWCRGGQPFEVVCLRPEPDSTRAEARAAADLAHARGWRHMVVVTTSHHAQRAGLLFRRCFDGEVSVVPSEPRYGIEKSVRQVAREWLGVTHARTLSRGC